MKLSVNYPPTDGQEKQVPATVRRVMNTLENAGHEAYLVGGCVRDMFLCRPIHDYDVATDALPTEVVRLFPDVKTIGLGHGTVTVVIDGVPVEVTTYRSDGPYSDGRHPDTVEFTSLITKDLARRDFTINAIAVDLRGNFRDPFEGQQDLEHRRLRAVGDPYHRFREDSLRILRGLRFVAELNFRLEDDTLAAMYCAAPELQVISAERIGQELSRMALAQWWNILDILVNGPWLMYTNPSLKPIQQSLRTLKAFQQHQDEWYQAAFISENTESMRLTAFIATLLLARPEDVQDSENNPIESPADDNRFRDLFRRLAWPKALYSQALQVAEWIISTPGQWPAEAWREKLFNSNPASLQLTCQLADWWDRVRGLSGTELGDKLSIPSTPCKPSPEKMQRFSTTALYQHYVAIQPIWRISDLALDSRQLIAFGARGPEIGILLRRLTVLVLHHKVDNKPEDLRAAAINFLQEIRKKENRNDDRLL